MRTGSNLGVKFWEIVPCRPISHYCRQIDISPHIILQVRQETYQVFEVLNYMHYYEHMTYRYLKQQGLVRIKCFLEQACLAETSLSLFRQLQIWQWLYEAKVILKHSCCNIVLNYIQCRHNLLQQYLFFQNCFSRVLTLFPMEYICFLLGIWYPSDLNNSLADSRFHF